MILRNAFKYFKTTIKLMNLIHKNIDSEEYDALMSSIVINTKQFLLIKIKPGLSKDITEICSNNDKIIYNSKNSQFSQLINFITN